MDIVTVKIASPTYRKYDLLKFGGTKETSIVLDIEYSAPNFSLITKKYNRKKYKVLNFICFWWVVISYLLFKKCNKIKKWLLSNPAQTTS